MAQLHADPDPDRAAVHALGLAAREAEASLFHVNAVRKAYADDIGTIDVFLAEAAVVRARLCKPT